MMRILVAMCLIALTIACAHRDAGKGLNKASGRKADFQAELPRRVNDTFFDSTFYIGYVDYFPETHEFYTALFYKDGHEYPDEDLLQSKLDSVIILDDDWGRERLPMEEARRILVLSGMDTLSVFNRRHENICDCPLTRIEYLWNGLESYFVAVFKYDNDSFEQTEELYGISADFRDYNGAPAEEITDRSLDEYVKTKLNMKKSIDWDMRHYRVSSPASILSIASSYSMESNEAMSYLTVVENDSISVLNMEVNNFHYLNILPVPVKVNDKPLLLISAGYPSSDVIWDYLAFFDSTAYQPMEYNRVPLEMLNVKPLADMTNHFSQAAVRRNAHGNAD
jgi:hypothetical protein